MVDCLQLVAHTGAVVIGRPLQLIIRSGFLVFVDFVLLMFLSDFNMLL